MDAACRIRPATTADAARLAVLERRSFTDPWSEASFHEVLALPGTIALIGEVDGAAVGYFLAREILGSAELLNLAVTPERRRRGIGQRLLEEGLAAVRSRGGREIFLEVRASNAAAQALYLGHGFRPAGRRRGYYQKPTEDALVLHLQLLAASG
jgi:[ribosomal protein S18]-alanine N-acetyltransferase